MRVGGIITPENWPGCRATAWTPAPTGFKVFTQLTDKGGRPVPGPLARLTASILQVQPQDRVSMMEILRALQGARRAQVSRLRLRKKVCPNTPWQTVSRTGAIHGGLAVSQAITGVAATGDHGLAASRIPKVSVLAGAETGDETRQRCACKGYCRRPGVHDYNGDNRTALPMCRFMAIPGRPMCEQCQCIYPDCDKGKSMKLMTCFSHFRFDPSLQVEIHPLARFDAVW